MALQGTIDAFPLGDVLTLLASSAKTGRLVLCGDRGRVALEIEAGSVVAAECDGAVGGRAELPVLEMLRFRDGEFEFHSATEGSDRGRSPAAQDLSPAPLAEVLESARQLLDRWSELERVVPSPRHRIALAPELPAESVEVDRSSWRVLSAAGSSVVELAERLGLDEFSATSLVADLVGAGLVELVEPALPDDDGGADLSLLDSVGTTGLPDVVGERSHEETSSVDVGGAAEFPDHFPIDDLIGSGDAAVEDDPWSSPEMEQLEAQRFAAAQSFESLEVEPLPMIDVEPLGDAAAESVPTVAGTADGSQAPPVGDTTDEVLRQMSKLSPQAAEAIAAALNTVPAASSEYAEDEEGGTGHGGTF